MVVSLQQGRKNATAVKFESETVISDCPTVCSFDRFRNRGLSPIVFPDCLRLFGSSMVCIQRAVVVND